MLKRTDRRLLQPSHRNAVDEILDLIAPLGGSAKGTIQTNRAASVTNASTSV